MGQTNAPKSAINFGGMNNTGTPNAGDNQTPDTALNSYGSAFNYSADDAGTQVYYRKDPAPPKTGPDFVGTPGVATVQPQNLADAYQTFTVLYKNDKKSFQDYQVKLYNGGFYDGTLKKGELPKFGRFDEATSKAIVAALHESARSGDPVEDVINNGMNSPTATQAQPYQTNTENIKSAVKALGPQLLGKEVPDEVVNRIVNTLHGAEDAAAQGNTGAQTAVQPDGAWYAEQLKELMPHTAKAYQTFEGLTSANLGAVNTLGKNG